MNIDRDRVFAELQKLAEFSDATPPAVTRVVYSEQDMRAREYVKGLFRQANLEMREDAVGNTFARWQGSEPELAAVGTGSHIDAIPHSGRYDGTVGVLGGLEAIRALQRAGARPRRSIELLLFTAEEPTRFGIGCFGSRLLAGVLDPASLRDADGRTLADWRGEIGPVELPAGYYDSFVELHIEQGPLLERDGIPIGVVTAIAAPASWRILVEGEGGHAGAVLMPDRRDAFCAAAEIALAVENAAKSTGAIDTVGTVGICEVFPGAVNSVPSRVQLSLDVRDIDQHRRDSVLSNIFNDGGRIAARRGVTVQIETINADAPAVCDERIVETIASAAESSGLAFQKMVSRAYHDSLFMARVAPTGMIFIPCRGGVSHRPDEYSSPEAIGAGVQVLAVTLQRLAAC
jgi:ureidoglycolate amidohydrolase